MQQFIDTAKIFLPPTATAKLEAVVQLRHVAHHGKGEAHSAGNQEAARRVLEAALNRDSAHLHDLGAGNCTIDGSSSREVCFHAACFHPMPKNIAEGTSNKYTRALGAPEGYVRFYLPPADIEKFSMKSAQGWPGSQLHHITASNGDGRVQRRREWCGCKECVLHPLLMSPNCTHRYSGQIEHITLKRLRPGPVQAPVSTMKG